MYFKITSFFSLVVGCYLHELAGATSVNVPLNVSDVSSTKLSKSLVEGTLGMSFEFSDFQNYNSVPILRQCMANIAPEGHTVPIRIGGSSQDHTYYNSSYEGTLVNVATGSTDLSNHYHFGPKYFDFVGNYSDDIIIGLNRGGEIQSNAFEAYTAAKSILGSKLTAVEFGNEPDQYPAGIAIRQHISPWTPAADSRSQAAYRIAFEDTFGDDDKISAGVFGKNPVQGWGVEELLTTNDSALDAVKYFSTHIYPGKRSGLYLTLPDLMNHTNITALLGPIYDADQAYADTIGKPLMFGELNSVSGGGTYISSMFGAGLWLQDFVFDALTHGFGKFYFHHGTYSPYAWFRYEVVESSYYGALFVAEALKDTARVASLDNHDSYIGVFGFYDSGESLSKVSVYNSKFYNSSTTATRSTQTVTLNINKSLKGKRLTAPGAETENAEGVSPTFGGQYAANVTCDITGSVNWEYYTPSQGKISIDVKDSEAILLYVDNSC